MTFKYFCKRFHLRCLIRFWRHQWDTSVFSLNLLAEKHLTYLNLIYFVLIGVIVVIKVKFDWPEGFWARVDYQMILNTPTILQYLQNVSASFSKLVHLALKISPKSMLSNFVYIPTWCVDNYPGARVFRPGNWLINIAVKHNKTSSNFLKFSGQ